LISSSQMHLLKLAAPDVIVQGHVDDAIALHLGGYIRLIDRSNHPNKSHCRYTYRITERGSAVLKAEQQHARTS